MRKKLIATATVCIASMFLQSCSSSTEIVRVTPENDQELTGLRFYEPKPFLVISTDPKTGVKDLSVIYMPNFKRQYSIEKGAETAVIVDNWRLEELNNKITFKKSEVHEKLGNTIELMPGMYEFVTTEENSALKLRKVRFVNSGN